MISAQKKLLVTGGSGDLGRVLCQRAAAAGCQVTATYLSRPERITAGTPYCIDLSDPFAVQTLCETLRPDVIIHTALTAPPSHIIGAARTLHDSSQHIAARCITISSDMVFDGTTPPYREDTPPSPLTDYGRAKVELEAIGRASENSCVVRTSLIYDFERGNKQVDWLLSEIAQGKRCRLFVDEYRSAIWVVNLADVLLELAENDVTGILNVGGPQTISRYALGQAILGVLGYDPATHIEPTSQVGTGRPPDLTMDVSRARHVLATPLLTAAEAASQR